MNIEETKICIKCKQNKLIKEFHIRRDRNKPFSECKLCKKERSKIYYINNKEKIDGRNKKYYLDNKDQISLDRKNYNREYRFKNREKLNNYAKEYVKKYYSENRDEVLEKAKKYFQKNKRKINEHRKERRKNDAGHKMRHFLSNRIRKALLRNTKSGPTLDLLGCSVEELKTHLSAKFQFGMSWENYGEWHIDHIIPCASFDLSDPKQQKICFHYSNLQPLWAKDNIAKGDLLSDGERGRNRT